ncbi:MAG: hypothetical protein KBT11_06575 [Treponema sp.]|nr:hypothetical protein [Candidatus Treponema equifaecale]
MAAKEKKEKKQKPVKMVSAKKLPGLFKKAYTEKDLEKKLLKKLYVEADKKLVESLFTEKVVKGKKEKLCVDKTKEFSQKDVKHLKAVAKQIKKNKGRIKLVPLIAVCGFVAALVVVIGIFKNPVTKMVIKSGCEAVFGAKTTVKSVDVKLLGISIDVRGLSIGNKNSEDGMKNLFDANIKLNVSLSDALRGKFVSEVISVTDMEFGRERTAKEGSCLLPAKEKAIKKEAEKDSQFMDSVKEKSANAIADVKAQIEALLGGSTPEEMWANIQSQLKSKEAAENLKTEAQEVAEKWKNKPAEMKAQAADLSERVNSYKNLNVKGMAPTEIAAKIKEIQDDLKAVESLSNSTKSIEKDFNADKAKIEAATKNLKSAVESDKALAEHMVDTVKNAGSILTSALDTIGYDMLGKYYPYAKMGLNYALQMKNNSTAASSEKKAEKPKKSATKVKGKTGRMKGTTFWYTAEKPSMWVKLVEASGPNFAGKIKNISSNQDLSGAPISGNADFTAKGIAHAANLVLDARSASKDPLVQMGYNGKGFMANIDGSKIAASSGIPSIAGTTNLTLKGTADADGITASGSVFLNPVTLTSDGFNNEKIDKYYKQALDSVKTLDIGYKVGFTESKGVDLALTGNYTDVFSKALSSVAAGVGADVKAQLQTKIAETTSGYSETAMAKVTEVTGISSDILAQVKSVDDMKKVLNDRLNELIKQQADAAKGKAASAVTNAVSNSKAGETASKAASGLLKFKK